MIATHRLFPTPQSLPDCEHHGHRTPLCGFSQPVFAFILIDHHHPRSSISPYHQPALPDVFFTLRNFTKPIQADNVSSHAV